MGNDGLPIIKCFAPYYRPHSGLFALDVNCAVVAGLRKLAFPVAITLFLDRLLPTGDLGLLAEFRPMPNKRWNVRQLKVTLFVEAPAR